MTLEKLVFQVTWKLLQIFTSLWVLFILILQKLSKILFKEFYVFQLYQGQWKMIMIDDDGDDHNIDDVS